ncbi:MAG TPA: hypothetical protein VGF76_14595, partial [Polyangiaceae bacterium]
MAPTFAALRAAREETTDETEERALWAQIEPALRRFKGQVSALDRELIRKGDISRASEQSIFGTFADLEQLPNELLSSGNGVSARTQKVLGARLQSEILPYLLMS